MPNLSRRSLLSAAAAFTGAAALPVAATSAARQIVHAAEPGAVAAASDDPAIAAADRWKRAAAEAEGARVRLHAREAAWRAAGHSERIEPDSRHFGVVRYVEKVGLTQADIDWCDAAEAWVNPMRAEDDPAVVAHRAWFAERQRTRQAWFDGERGRIQASREAFGITVAEDAVRAAELAQEDAFEALIATPANSNAGIAAKLGAGLAELACAVGRGSYFANPLAHDGGEIAHPAPAGCARSIRLLESAMADLDRLTNAASE